MAASAGAVMLAGTRRDPPAHAPTRPRVEQVLVRELIERAQISHRRTGRLDEYSVSARRQGASKVCGSMHSGSDPQLSLGEYLAPLHARRWLILALVAIATVGAYAYYERKGEVYETSTKLYLAEEANLLIGAGTGYTDDRSVVNQAQLLTSGDVARSVAKRIKYEGSPESLASMVTATPAEGSDFVTVTARAGTPQDAAKIANGFAQAFIDIRDSNRRAQVTKALEQLRRQLRSTPRTQANATDRAEIASNMRQLEVTSASAPGNATQVDPASAPAAAVGRKPWHKALFVGFAALIGSILLAYALYRLDPRLRTVEQAVAVYQRPVLANVLHDDGIVHFADGRPAISPASKETFRELRVNIHLGAIDKLLRTIVVTSAGPGEGKSTVARNLALALHEAGRRVALFDADLRKSSLPALLGVSSEHGFTDVLAGERPLEEVLIAVDVESAGVAALGRMSSKREADNRRGDGGPSVEALTLLPSGPSPPNPPAVLESSAAHELLGRVAVGHDVLVIDTTPLRAVADAIPLLSFADGVLIVARSGVTDRRTANQAAEIIGRVPGVNLLGVVLNDLEGAEASAYGREYGYGYGHRSKNGTPGRRPSEHVASE